MRIQGEIVYEISCARDKFVKFHFKMIITIIRKIYIIYLIVFFYYYYKTKYFGFIIKKNTI